MRLASGTRLGPYEIQAAIGAGGMGEVYKARDTRLDRTVAIKVLPLDANADPDRRARFEREAKTIAGLNHPNICSLHDVGDHDGSLFLVMEHVPGETLAARLQNGPLPLENALIAATEIADALAVAHRHGIVHRDLKPANVMLTKTGAKLLDFGLAKLRLAADMPSVVATFLPTAQPTTGKGVVLGTVPYMAPEQLEGKEADARSDLFSFGAVLYEMLAGKRAFAGASAASVIAAILEREPTPLSSVQPLTPFALDRLVRRCLAKDPDRRPDTAHDVADELRLIRELGALPVDTKDTRAGHSPRRLAWLGASIMLCAALVGGAFLLGWRIGRGTSKGSTPPRPSVMQLTSLRGVTAFPSLSPDGRWLAYTGDAAGRWDVYLQSIGSHNPINLTKDAPAASYQPAFSPDGQWIAFASDREGGGIFVMGLTGENVRRVSDVGFNPAWSPDGLEIAYATLTTTLNPYDRQGKSELWTVKVATGEKRQVFAGDGMQPQWSPHRRRIAFWGYGYPRSQRDIWTVAVAGGTPVPVTNDEPLDWSPAWSADGKWLYFASDRGGALNMWRIAIDEESGAVLGEPQLVSTPSRWVGHLALSLDGTRLAFSSFTGTRNIERYHFEPVSATITGLGEWVTSRSQYASTMNLDLSPDGKSLVFTAGATHDDLIICDSDGSHLRALTNDGFRNRGPRWSANGNQIAFFSNRNGRWESWLINSDGSGLKLLGTPKQLRSLALTLPSWSLDGSRMTAADLLQGLTLIFDARTPWADQSPEVLRGPPIERESALATRTTDIIGNVPALTRGVSSFVVTSWSPDGNSVAGYTADGIATYSLKSKEYRVLTRDGGIYPYAWLKDNRRILYLRQGALAVVDAGSLKVNQVLSVRPDTLGSFAISRDDRLLYVGRASNQADIWLATLK